MKSSDRKRPPLYNSWMGMRMNCLKSKYMVGIGICKEWMTYANYEKWCFENGWKNGLMVARIDKEKDFCPSNCKIVTRIEFNGMRRNVRRIEDGRTVREATGIRWECDRSLAKRVRWRVLVGNWDIDSAIHAPKMSPKETVHIGWGTNGCIRKRMLRNKGN